MRSILVIGVLMAAPAFAQVAEPEGYRMEEYRAPVPETLSGATVLDVAAAFDLWEAGGAAFVDVLPKPPKPKNLPEDTIWQEKIRQSIPGAAWLPNTGYGALAGETTQYFGDGLQLVTDGDPDHPIVIFCLAECWMSWNAAKRALEMGYTDVSWMPTGTDGWAKAEHELEVVEPMRMPGSS